MFQTIWESVHCPRLPYHHPPLKEEYRPQWPPAQGGRSQPWVNLWPHRGTCYPKVPCPFLASPQTAWYPTPTQTATTTTPAAPITMPQCPLGDPTMGISMDPLATLAPEWPLGVNPTTGINTKKFAPAGEKTTPRRFKCQVNATELFLYCVLAYRVQRKNLKEFVNI